MSDPQDVSSISPTLGTTYFGYVPAALPFAAPPPPPPGSSTGSSSTPSSGATPPAATDQFALATEAYESQLANALFGAPASSNAAATPGFFSSAGMLSLLNTSGGAVLSYLNASAQTPPPTSTLDASA